MHDRSVTGLGQIIGIIAILTNLIGGIVITQIDRHGCIMLLGYAGSADIRVVTEVGIDMVELGSGCRVDLIVADIVLEEGNQLAGGQLGAQFGDQVAIRTGNGGHRAAVLVVESDTVESVLIYGIGENRCKLIGLRVIETREVDILPVRQDGEHDFDALSLQTGYIGGSTAVFEQVGHLVVQIEGRTHYSVDRLLVEIGGEELHDIGIGRTVGEQVVAGIKRVHVVGLDINGDLRSFVPVSTCFDDRFLGLVHRRFFCLLAGDHHRCTGCQCCE